MRETLKRCLQYFSLVFTAGFVLGVLRELVVVPVTGERYAELLEMPVMLCVIYFAAKWVAQASQHSLTSMALLTVGINALFLPLLFEFTLILGLRGMTIGQYFDSRDWVSGGAYLFSLVFYALAPWLCSQRKPSRPTSS